MASGQRFRGGGARGISQFLVRHQGCEAGFDVRRQQQGGDSGRLLITCLGCGESLAHSAAGAAGPALAAANGEAAVAGSGPERAAAAADPGREAAGAGRATRGDGARSLLPAVLVGILFVAGLALLAVGLSRSGEDAEEAGGTGASTAPATTPAPAPDNEAPQRGAGAAATARAQGAPPGRRRAKRRSVRLRRRAFLGVFAIGIPRGWSAGQDGIAVVLAADGGVAAVRIFYEPGEDGLRRLASGAAGLLAREHPGAAVTRARPLRVGPERALRVRADYDGGVEIATVLAAGGRSFVLMTRVDRGASKAVGEQARASTASFKAR